jgi:hypothetical protein
MLEGMTAAKPFKKLPKMAFNKFTNHSKTHMVMANGSQTSKPVSKYFFMGTWGPVVVGEKINCRSLAQQPVVLR